ncbi:MAG: hypothetical protein U0R64_09180 [Candidatus Nanopelagicales bacterium]
MYSTKVLGNTTDTTMSINHSSHKATMKDAIKNKKAVPQTPKKK